MLLAIESGFSMLSDQLLRIRSAPPLIESSAKQLAYLAMSRLPSQLRRVSCGGASRSRPKPFSDENGSGCIGRRASFAFFFSAAWWRRHVEQTAKGTNF